MIIGKNMKERILRLLSDGRWHSSLEIALAVGRGGPAWSWDQRKNELIRDHGFHIEREIDEHGRVDLESQLLGFAAEEARTKGTTVEMSEYRARVGLSPP